MPTEQDIIGKFIKDSMKAEHIEKIVWRWTCFFCGGVYDYKVDKGHGGNKKATDQALRHLRWKHEMKWT
jgi:hypothetical protein